MLWIHREVASHAEKTSQGERDGQGQNKAGAEEYDEENQQGQGVPWAAVSKASCPLSPRTDRDPKSYRG